MFTFPAFYFWAENIQEGKFLKKLCEASFPLQRMIDKNPVLQKLIDELDLVLVDGS